ncbi:MAG: hypothetical protein IID44_30630 [Planctomycetes bacterium]|nr:hypothetical protein [Planctomycetota bacterium]
MSTEISPDNEAFICRAVENGQFESRQDALDAAVGLLRDEVESISAIQEGLDSIERGEGIPLAEADALLRKKHGIAPN